MGELAEAVAKARHERDQLRELAIFALSYGIDSLVAILCTAESTASFATFATDYADRVEEMAAEIEPTNDTERFFLDATRTAIRDVRAMLAEPRPRKSEQVTDDLEGA